MCSEGCRGCATRWKALAREIAKLTSRPLRAAGLPSETDPDHAGDRPSPGDDPWRRRCGGQVAVALARCGRLKIEEQWRSAAREPSALIQPCFAACSTVPCPATRFTNASTVAVITRSGSC